jgi:hypothetical protein
MNLCRKCLISKTYSPTKKPQILTLLETDNTDKNIILNAIMSKIGSIGIKGTFTVLCDGRRYKITVIKKNKRKIMVNQQYLHYDNGHIWPIYDRIVKIIK